jgi:hypothetical protein
MKYCFLGKCLHNSLRNNAIKLLLGASLGTTFFKGNSIFLRKISSFSLRKIKIP